MMENRQETAEGSQGEQLSWPAMTAADFGAAPRPVQGALFQEPDEYGTLDLFDTAGE